MSRNGATRLQTAGFTLLEVLAVVLLTSIVIGVALDHYVSLNQASERALNTTRSMRRAAALLDRVSRDLEAALLVTKPPDVDPLAHPWIFYGESLRDTEGADHLKFITRGRRPRDPATKESDHEIVVYTLRYAELEEDQFELMRWASPRLGEDLNRETPAEETDGAMLLSDGILDFGVTFIDDAGERTDRWDSSQMVQSGTLPAAAEVRVTLFDASLTEGTEPPTHSRTVILPVRPLDFEELLDPLSLVSGGPGEMSGLTDESGEPIEGGPDLAQCLTTSCSKQMACDAINCTSKLGRISESIDVLLEVALREKPTFCQWRANNPSKWHYLIDNPSCRRP